MLDRYIDAACRGAGIDVDGLADVIGDGGVSNLWGFAFEDFGLVRIRRAQRRSTLSEALCQEGITGDARLNPGGPAIDHQSLRDQRHRHRRELDSQGTAPWRAACEGVRALGDSRHEALEPDCHQGGDCSRQDADDRRPRGV